MNWNNFIAQVFEGVKELCTGSFKNYQGTLVKEITDSAFRLIF